MPAKGIAAGLPRVDVFGQESEPALPDETALNLGRMGDARVAKCLLRDLLPVCFDQQLQEPPFVLVRAFEIR